MSLDALKRIWPEWEIDETPLGRGSFGVVYRAVRRDHGVEDYSAIKVISIPTDPREIDSLRSEGLSLEGSRTYFQRIVNDFTGEIQTMVDMKGMHNIVTVEDYRVVERTAEVGWDIYIRMELLTSISSRRLTEQEVIRLGSDLCAALEACEAQHIIHRDIKPENIFINRFGDYKLGDFGIARKLENATGGLSQKGTFNYMAPEVAQSGHYDARVDIYSLGLVLYRFLNENRLPFLTEAQLLSPEARRIAVERRIFNGEALPAPCEASPAMAAFILRACAYDPNQRFANAAEMRQALQRVADGTYLASQARAAGTAPVRPTSGSIDGTVQVHPSQGGRGTAAQGYPPQGGNAGPARVYPPQGGNAGQTPMSGAGETPQNQPDGKKKRNRIILGILIAALVLELVFLGFYFFVLPKLQDTSGSSAESSAETASPSPTAAVNPMPSVNAAVSTSPAAVSPSPSAAASPSPSVSPEVSPSPTNNSTVVSTKYVYNCDYGLCLWKDTTCKEYYEIVLVGEAVGYIEDDAGGKYAKVSYKNYIGYMNKDHLSDSQPEPDTVQYQMYVNTDNVSLRKGPTSNYDVICTVNLNAEVGYYRDMKDHSEYAKVQYNGATCYVLKQYLSKDRINNTVISTKYIDNLGAAACLWKDTTAQAYWTTVPLGEPVGFIEYDTSGAFARVSYGGKYGYIRSEYLSDTKPDITVKYNQYINADNVAFLKTRNAAGEANCYLSKNTSVGVISDDGDYAKVKYNGVVGYVLSSYLSDSIQEDPEPVVVVTGIQIQGASASSVLYDGLGISYEPSNVYDQRNDTSWVEGASDDGIGESITLTVAAGSTITGITIKPGYCKNSELFAKNNCPSELEFSCGGQTCTLDLSSYVNDYNSCSSGITINFSSPMTSDGTVTLTIRAVRTGSKYSDTPISEISLIGS